MPFAAGTAWYWPMASTNGKVEGSGYKQPWYITLTSGEPFAFAGLWERWEPKPGTEGDPVESCTIIVTDANGCLRPIHDRMPVMLHPAEYDRWLDPTDKNPVDLLKPYPEELMTRRPVSKRVNRPKHDDPECIEPVMEEELCSEFAACGSVLHVNLLTV